MPRLQTGRGAGALHLSLGTVNTHLTRIRQVPDIGRAGSPPRLLVARRAVQGRTECARTTRDRPPITRRGIRVTDGLGHGINHAEYTRRVATIEEILRLEPIEKDIYSAVRPLLSSCPTFGGQGAAQALTRRMHGRPTTHSLHGYFLRPGNPRQTDRSWSTASGTDGRS